MTLTQVVIDDQTGNQIQPGDLRIEVSWTMTGSGLTQPYVAEGKDFASVRNMTRYITEHATALGLST